MSHSTFHPQSDMARAYMVSKGGQAQLLKLTPNVEQLIIIPDDAMVRALVPIHFGAKLTKSRLCSGTAACVDCKDEIPLSFHLYVGCYSMPDGFRRIVGLGTAIPRQWDRKLPDFSSPFKVWRVADKSPIMIASQPFKRFDQSVFKAWDVMPDVLSIFRGRHSADMTIGDDDPKTESPDSI